MVEPQSVPPQGKGPTAVSLPRARQPFPPAVTRESGREDAEREAQRRTQEHQERTRMFRGLLLLAVMILLLSMRRAGWERVFVPGWWRQW